MANQFLNMGRFNEAEALYQQVLREDPGNSSAMLALGILYSKREKPEQAIAKIQQLIEREPDNVEAHLRLGDVHRDHGRLDDAADSYRRALEYRPDSLHALSSLSIITRHTDYTDEIRRLESHFQDPDLPDASRRSLGFILGKAFDDLGDYPKAFDYFTEANRLAKAQYSYSLPAQIDYLKKMQEYFDEVHFERHRNTGIEDDSPIFVTGMPRSGTTLIEQILASHPDVYGGGERNDIPNIVRELNRITNHPFPINMNLATAEILNEKARRYVTGIKSLAGSKQYFTDKAVSNIMYIGLIATMLPNAKIVYCSRDPRDQGLSCFQKDFGDTQPYCYDLSDIGTVNRESGQLMDHWLRVLPDRIHPVRYEELVSDFENQVQSLLEYCGLPFDSRCLDFHQTKRLLNTQSLAQVRQPVYRSSVGRWKNYERQLQPLIEALEMTGHD